MASQDGDIKIVKGLSHKFIVDGFQFMHPQCKAYFLTHYHSDHTIGLKTTFCGPVPIYCSPVTAALLAHDFGVDQKWIRVIDVGQTVDVEGVAVTAIDANHCPGAVMFYFFEKQSTSPPQGCSVLHVGDFRADACLRKDPLLLQLLAQRPLDRLYLDTTYCRPRFDFPPQNDVLDSLAAVVRDELTRQPRTLFAISAYALGKERAIAAVVRAAGGTCLVSEKRARVLRLCGFWEEKVALCRRDNADATESASCLVDSRSKDMFTCDPQDDDINCVVLSSGGSDHAALVSCWENLPTPTRERFSTVVCFKATGWTFVQSKDGTPPAYKPWVHDVNTSAGVSDPAKGHKGVGTASSGLEVSKELDTRIYSMPYSEHSSYSELQLFVQAVQPRSLIPTVIPGPGSGRSNDDTKKMPPKAAELRRAVVDEHFVGYLNLEKDRSRLDSFLVRTSDAKSESKSATPAKLLQEWPISSPKRASLSSASVLPCHKKVCVADEGALRDVAEIIFGGLPLCDDHQSQYLESLLQGSGGSVEDAVAIHYGPNGGSIPDSFSTTSWQNTDLLSSSSSQSLISPNMGTELNEKLQCPSSCSSDANTLGHFPSGAYFVVFGKDAMYSVFGSRTRAEMRIKELGGRVQSRRTISTTHVLVANGVDRASVPHRLLYHSDGNGGLTVVDEGWLLRHVRHANIQKLSSVQERDVPAPQSSMDQIHEIS